MKQSALSVSRLKYVQLACGALAAILACTVLLTGWSIHAHAYPIRVQSALNLLLCGVALLLFSRRRQWLAVVAAGLATSLVVQHRSLVRSRKENAALREQSKQLDQLRGENERLRKFEVDATELQGLRREHGELIRLRGEVALLRKENQRLAKLEADNKGLSRELFAAREASDGKETQNEFLPADEWIDMGSATPETAAQTWIWRRRSACATFSHAVGT